MGKNDPPIEPLTVQRAEDVLERLAPGFRLESHTEMRGSFSNSTWLVTGRGAGDAVARFVVRRLRGGWSDPSKRASLEFHALRLAVPPIEVVGR